MAAAVAQGSGLAFSAQKHHNVFTQQGEGLRAACQLAQRHDSVPELSKNGLLGHQHEALLKVGISGQFPACTLLVQVERFYPVRRMLAKIKPPPLKLLGCLGTPNLTLITDLKEVAR